MLTLKKIRRGYVRFKINLKYALNIKKPLLVLRIIKAYLNILIIRKVPLRYVDVAVGYGCNLSCQHCSAYNLLNKTTSSLSIADYKKLAKQCLRAGAVTVGFTGGEPTISPKLSKIIKAFQPNKIMISLVTNATLLDSERISKLKRLGVDILCISLDSFYEEEHDLFRGSRGAYKKTFNAINLALEKNMKVVIATTVTHNNLRSDGIKQLIELTRKMNILLIFSLACPAGKWNKKDREILLNQEDVEYMNRLFLDYPHLRRDFESNWLKKGCGAGNEKLYFTPYGEVIPCPFIHISFGNIRDTPLEVIHSRLLRIPEFKGYPKKCLSGEDSEFSAKYVVRANIQRHVPVSYQEVF